MQLDQPFYSNLPKSTHLLFNVMTFSVIIVWNCAVKYCHREGNQNGFLKKQFLVVSSIVSISPRIRLLGTPSRIGNATFFWGCWYPPLLLLSHYAAFFVFTNGSTHALMTGLSFTLHFNNALFIWKLEHPNYRWRWGLFHQTLEWGQVGREWGGEETTAGTKNSSLVILGHADRIPKQFVFIRHLIWKKQHYTYQNSFHM